MKDSVDEYDIEERGKLTRNTISDGPGYESVSEEMLATVAQERDRASKSSESLLLDRSQQTTTEACTREEQQLQLHVKAEPVPTPAIDLADYSTITDTVVDESASTPLYSTVRERGVKKVMGDGYASFPGDTDEPEPEERTATDLKGDNSKPFPCLDLYSVVNKQKKLGPTGAPPTGVSPELADYSTIADVQSRSHDHCENDDYCDDSHNVASLKEPESIPPLPPYTEEMNEIMDFPDTEEIAAVRDDALVSIQADTSSTTSNDIIKLQDGDNDMMSLTQDNISSSS